ncbi:MAG: hypothetical protein P8124_03170 [Gammaproteobacteria bacterium]
MLSVLGLVGLIVAYEIRRRRDRQAAHQSMAWLEQLRSEAADDAAHLRAHIGRIGDELANRSVDPQTRRLAVHCAALAETKPDPESAKLRHLLAQRGIDVQGLGADHHEHFRLPDPPSRRLG